MEADVADAAARIAFLMEEAPPKVQTLTMAEVDSEPVDDSELAGSEPVSELVDRRESAVSQCSNTCVQLTGRSAALPARYPTRRYVDSVCDSSDSNYFESSSDDSDADDTNVLLRSPPPSLETPFCHMVTVKIVEVGDCDLDDQWCFTPYVSVHSVDRPKITPSEIQFCHALDGPKRQGRGFTLAAHKWIAQLFCFRINSNRREMVNDAGMDLLIEIRLHASMCDAATRPHHSALCVLSECIPLLFSCVRLDTHLPLSNEKYTKEDGWSTKRPESREGESEGSVGPGSGAVTHDLHGVLLLHSALPFRRSSVWVACKTDSAAPSVTATLKLDVLVRPLSVAADDPTALLARDPFGCATY
jgi:hypothetical protein